MIDERNREPQHVEDYDDESVFYCLDCHSLCIKCDEGAASDESDGLYCAKCDSTNIGQCDIQEWVAEEDRLRRKDEDDYWDEGLHYREKK